MNAIKLIYLDNSKIITITYTFYKIEQNVIYYLNTKYIQTQSVGYLNKYRTIRKMLGDNTIAT